MQQNQLLISMYSKAIAQFFNMWHLPHFCLQLVQSFLNFTRDFGTQQHFSFPSTTFFSCGGNNSGSCWLSSGPMHTLHLCALGIPNFWYRLISCFQDAGATTVLSPGFPFLPFNVSNSPNNSFPTSDTSSTFPERESNKRRKIWCCKPVDMWVLSKRACNSMVQVRSASPIVSSFPRISFSSFSHVHPFASTTPPCPLPCTGAPSDCP